MKVMLQSWGGAWEAGFSWFVVVAGCGARGEGGVVCGDDAPVLGVRLGELGRGHSEVGRDRAWRGSVGQGRAGRGRGVKTWSGLGGGV